MSETEFWKIVGMLDWDQVGDDEAVIEPAVVYLASQPVEEIFGFEDMLAEKLHALDTKAHASEIGRGAYGTDHFSEDEFLYCRCVVVANGKEVYDLILKNPKEFPKEVEFEAILYIAAQAFERKTGEDWEHTPPFVYETFSNSAGWDSAPT